MSQSEQILPIDAVARANGVRLTRYLASLRFFIFPLECPTRWYIRRPYRWSPWRSVPSLPIHFTHAVSTPLRA